MPDDDVRRAMIAELPGLEFKIEHAKFCDHWRSQPGQKGVKVDWNATWRNWMRRAAEFQPRPLRAVESDEEAARKARLAKMGFGDV